MLTKAFLVFALAMVDPTQNHYYNFYNVQRVFFWTLLT
ncbi:unnamed protein product [Brugia timori]|uniref:Uncharacterized protein n=1 Tax=Brugia timori TaxID=42155 RepID=A0A3P7WIN7_9BILA|nr:unnamed protein product [Brugia timori]